MSCKSNDTPSPATAKLLQAVRSVVEDNYHPSNPSPSNPPSEIQENAPPSAVAPCNVPSSSTSSFSQSAPAPLKEGTDDPLIKTEAADRVVIPPSLDLTLVATAATSTQPKVEEVDRQSMKMEKQEPSYDTKAIMKQRLRSYLSSNKKFHVQGTESSRRRIKPPQLPYMGPKRTVAPPCIDNPQRKRGRGRRSLITAVATPIPVPATAPALDPVSQHLNTVELLAELDQEPMPWLSENEEKVLTDTMKNSVGYTQENGVLAYPDGKHNRRDYRGHRNVPVFNLTIIQPRASIWFGKNDSKTGISRPVSLDDCLEGNALFDDPEELVFDGFKKGCVGIFVTINPTQNKAKIISIETECNGRKMTKAHFAHLIANIYHKQIGELNLHGHSDCMDNVYTYAGTNGVEFKRLKITHIQFDESTGLGFPNILVGYST